MTFEEEVDEIVAEFYRDINTLDKSNLCVKDKHIWLERIRVKYLGKCDGKETP